jgi:hypothetical protein
VGLGQSPLLVQLHQHLLLQRHQPFLVQLPHLLVETHPRVAELWPENMSQATAKAVHRVGVRTFFPVLPVASFGAFFLRGALFSVRCFPGLEVFPTCTRAIKLSFQPQGSTVLTLEPLVGCVDDLSLVEGCVCSRACNISGQ